MGALGVLAKFARCDTANVALTFALTLPVLLGFGALAVDEASLYHERRMAQAAVDLAAISAARDPDNAEALVREILTEKRLEGGTVETEVLGELTLDQRLQVQLGTYLADPELDPASRFDPDGSYVNAVRVRYRRTGQLYFAGWWADPPEIYVAATAAVSPEVAFSVGSRLASLHGGVLNAVLGGLLGTSLSLDVMSYEALVDADVELFSTLDALALELGITGVTYNELLQSEVTGGMLAAALADTLDSEAGTAAALIADASPGGALDLSRLLDLGPYGAMSVGSAPSGLVTGVSALEMLTASSALSGGENQAALSLDLGVPGIAELAVRLAIGAPPAHAWFVVGQRGAVARTAQTRLQLTARLLGNPATGNGAINLPIYIEMAYAEAAVRQATCPGTGSPNGTADIDTRPGIVRLALSEAAEDAFAEFNAPPTLNPAEILSLPFVRVSGSAALDMGSLQPERLRFSSTDIGQVRHHTAGTGTALESAVSSLFDNLDLNVEALGLGLGSALIGHAVAQIIVPVTPVLDQALNLLLDTLGLSLGEADVRVYEVLCVRSVLVG